MTIRTLLASSVACAAFAVNAQYLPPDTAALEGIIVERYYVCDVNDAGDTDGGPGLVQGAVVYRVFADLKPGYILETVYGDADHQLFLETTTTFWNNTDRGETSGDLIPANRLDENTVAIDSWITVGSASDAHWGVPKDEDTDGSIVGGMNNDGGSNGVSGGLLVNMDPNAGTPLTTADGLLAGTPPSIVTIGLDLSAFDDQASSLFSTNNGAWAVLGGTVGPDSSGSNKILLGQFTTEGTFSFELNMRVGIPDSLQCGSPLCHTYIDYYANLLPSDTTGGGVAADNQVGHPELSYTSSALVDCEGVPGGPALPGTPCDDGDPFTVNEWNPNCDCITTNVGLEDLAGPFTGVAIYPNPADDVLNVQLSLEGSEAVSLELVDLLGARMMARDLGTRTGSTVESIDLGGLSAGAYFLRLQAGDGLVVRRVVKF